ncbi:MAG TPA: hypothetical protein VNG32_01095, partial [Candidatus Dormibacteraeota bacterium]|nr:hypothetical protein [Candidatus Dormibacteraeota bacterium]
RINTLKNAQPSKGAAVSQINSSTNIDQATIDKITQLQDNSVSVQATNDQKTQLAENKKDIATYADLNTIAKSVVPQDKDQAEAVREIVSLASQSGIPQLSSIFFPPSTLGGTSVKIGGGLTQVTAVKGIAGVYDLQITITQTDSDAVPYGSFIAFLSKLEQNRRTAQVSSINVQPNQTNPSLVAFTLVIDEFIKP